MAKLSAVVLALAMMAGLASARVSMESSISSFKRFTWAQGARISADDVSSVNAPSIIFARPSHGDLLFLTPPTPFGACLRPSMWYS